MDWHNRLQTAYKNGEFRKVYRQYLKSQKWMRVKEEFLSNPDNNYCQACWKFKRLQVHHKTYQRVGVENLDDLITLCSRCHKKLHREHYDLDLFIYKKQKGEI